MSESVHERAIVYGCMTLVIMGSLLSHDPNRIINHFSGVFGGVGLGILIVRAWPGFLLCGIRKKRGRK